MEYTLIRSNRKTLSVQIKPNGAVVVRAPRRMGKRQIEEFLQTKSHWIEKHLSSLHETMQPRLTEQEIITLREVARQRITARVSHFAPILGVTCGRITIRTQRTRWGSCSAEGNLNFNALLVLSPEEVLDYVVVHELCHRREMNHSDRFWALVESVLPDYRLCRKWLKDNGNQLLSRLGD